MDIVSDPTIQARSISVHYGKKQILSEVSCSVARGEAVGIIGPNGAGKTTLLRSLVGSVRLTSGEVSIEGVPLQKLRPRQLGRMIALVPQKLTVGFGLLTWELVALGRTPYLGRLGQLSAVDRRAITSAMASTGLKEFANQPVAELSGGELQRAVLAMALAQETPYLFMDEPTVHLDLGQSWRFMEMMREFTATESVGVLAVLHDLALAKEYFDRLVLLRGGVICAEGRPEEVTSAANLAMAFDLPPDAQSDAGWIASHPRVGSSTQ